MYCFYITVRYTNANGSARSCYSLPNLTKANCVGVAHGCRRHTIELAARNPGGAKNQIADALHEINERITMLAFAKDSAALGENEDRLISGLQMIHRRLRRECDRLFMLLYTGPP